MDWYSWLSKSGLEPSLVYEYSLLLSHNELEEEDVSHFNHEFLQSMGISIAKHRLEILKLAKKEKNNIVRKYYFSSKPIARILAAISKTKKCVAGYLRRTSLDRCDSSAIVVVPRPSYAGGRSKGTMLKRNKRLVLLKQGRLMITDGGVRFSGRPHSNSHSDSTIVYKNDGGGGGDGFWGSDAEEIRWDSMFQDLKPT